MKNKKIAIITARGGSKRIPRKNIKTFCGRPIIEYSVKAAIESGLFDEVMVSTDSQEIAQVAKKAGAKVPFMRSKDTSNDYATTADVILEVLEEYQKRGETYTYACCLYPTAPFVTVEKLREAYRLLKTNNASELIPIVKYSFPPQRCFVLDQNTNIQMKWPENKNVRSQDLEPLYHDCGQFYFFNVRDFIKTNGQIDNKIIPMIMPETEVQDIDNEEDWMIAEIKYKSMLHKDSAK